MDKDETLTRNELLELANTFYTGGFTEREIAFARVIAAAEREKFCAVLRQLHDSYALASSNKGFDPRKNT